MTSQQNLGDKSPETEGSTQLINRLFIKDYRALKVSPETLALVPLLLYSFKATPPTNRQTHPLAMVQP